jgi:hypothetical protein
MINTCRGNSIMLVSRSANANDRSVPAKAGWLFGIALVAGALTFGGVAAAGPLAVPKSTATAFESDVLQVRDGCGRGMRFSNRRNRCVPIEREFRRDDDFEDEGQGRRRSQRRNNDSDAAAAAVATGVILGIIGATAVQSNRRGNGGAVNQGGSSGGTQSINGGSGKRKRN